MMNWTRRFFLLALIPTLITGCFAVETDSIKNAPVVDNPPRRSEAAGLELDAYTSKKLDTLLDLSAKGDSVATGQSINTLSKAFIGTPYRANMLRGAKNTPEQLIIDFRGLDCFTYLEYVEALRKSSSKPDFVYNLIETRYKSDNVDFLNRRHFFSDWAYNTQRSLADDITAQTSPNAVSVDKRLNEKADGGAYLPGLPIVKRTLTYIPSAFIDKKVISRLQTGDYIGLYTDLPGLDVTHVGFFIMTDKGPFLRHASLKKGKVVDLPFLEYVSQKPGIIVYRPKIQPGQRDVRGNVL